MGQQRRFRLSNGQPVVVPDEWDEDRVAAVLTEMEGELAASPTKTLDMPAGTGGLPMGRPDLFPGIPTRTPPPVNRPARPHRRLAHTSMFGRASSADSMTDRA